MSWRLEQVLPALPAGFDPLARTKRTIQALSSDDLVAVRSELLKLSPAHQRPDLVQLLEFEIAHRGLGEG